MTSTGEDSVDVLPAAREMLAALWTSGHEQRCDARGDQGPSVLDV